MKTVLTNHRISRSLTSSLLREKRIATTKERMRKHAMSKKDVKQQMATCKHCIFFLFHSDILLKSYNVNHIRAQRTSGKRKCTNRAIQRKTSNSKER